MIVYHSSNHLFDKPDIEMIKANITGHGNGLLGLWFSTTNSWQENFGKYTYEIEIPKDFVAIDFSIDDFAKMCHQATDFNDIRDGLIQNGCDVLRVIEQNGNIDMGVLLNLNVELTLLNGDENE